MVTVLAEEGDFLAVKEKLRTRVDRDDGIAFGAGCADLSGQRKFTDQMTPGTHDGFGERIDRLVVQFLPDQKMHGHP